MLQSNIITILLLFVAPGILFSGPCLSENIQGKDISLLMDSLIIYNNRYYSLDKLVYAKTNFQGFVSDSDAKAIIYDEYDTARKDYQDILNEAKASLNTILNKYIIYDSSDFPFDTIDFIFPQYYHYWLNDYLIINNTINDYWPIFNNKTVMISYNYKTREIIKYKARNLRYIGANYKVIYFIIDSAGYIENLSTSRGDIVSFTYKGFEVITKNIWNKYLSKINLEPSDNPGYITNFIEYYDGENIIFDNDTSKYRIGKKKLEVLSHLPKKFTIIDDTILSLDDFYLEGTKSYLDSMISVLLRNKSDKRHCSNYYLLNKKGLKICIKLSDLINLDLNQLGEGWCVTYIYYINEYFALIKLEAITTLLCDAIIVDLKKMKIIAKPKIIIK